MDDFARAYAAGQRAAARRKENGDEIVEPAYGRIHSARYAEALITEFWKGVRSV
jgi:hypothetical protein